MTTTMAATDPVRRLLSRIAGDEKHGPSAHSTLDVLWVLYDRVLRVSPATVDEPGRDRFVLSKGHGLGLAVGMALGLRAQGFAEARTFVLLGDAELDEGSNHEAIAYAAAARIPLTAIVIDNQSATHGWPGGIAARFIGWETSIVDGRDRDEIERALERRDRDRPDVVVATVAPKGE
jgi:transketolase